MSFLPKIECVRWFLKTKPRWSKGDKNSPEIKVTDWIVFCIMDSKRAAAASFAASSIQQAYLRSGRWRKTQPMHVLYLWYTDTKSIYDSLWHQQHMEKRKSLTGILCTTEKRGAHIKPYVIVNPKHSTSPSITRLKCGHRLNFSQMTIV